ncbi:hypothetical protein L6452_09091 [Arctium lappa]|uniref:Uncharacterized protein n=1 Tax=Arctium lappa TaxID=4217 RepID=A0ACB9DK37_ARCLA|nr:hypothetical protein L6452_09091 [Arctium lappa]
MERERQRLFFSLSLDLIGWRLLQGGFNVGWWCVQVVAVVLDTIDGCLFLVQVCRLFLAAGFAARVFCSDIATVPRRKLKPSLLTKGAFVVGGIFLAVLLGCQGAISMAAILMAASMMQDVEKRQWRQKEGKTLDGVKDVQSKVGQKGGVLCARQDANIDENMAKGNKESNAIGKPTSGTNHVNDGVSSSTMPAPLMESVFANFGKYTQPRKGPLLTPKTSNRFGPLGDEDESNEEDICLDS